MDLIYTNSKRIDQGILDAYSFDLSFGANENDFEMSLSADSVQLEFGAFVYMEGTEYGGIVDGINTKTNKNTITYKGRTWHGLMNSKVIQPPAGAGYLVVSGDVNDVLAMLIANLGLGDLFVVDDSPCGITVKNHKFNRYCSAYDGIRSMLKSVGAKLQIKWENRMVHLMAVPIVDYTDYPVDGDIATLQVQKYEKKVNHLICLGKGELTDRTIIHLYVEQFGRIGDAQYYTGIDENAQTYDYSSAESEDVLRSSGISKLKELRDNDTADISIPENESLMFDIGDIVDATDIATGISATAAVTQKIVKINNGTVKISYKTGGA